MGTAANVCWKRIDVLLTASEIAQLKINADFVVLSACNMAAGEKPGAEALSGLARAFFMRVQGRFWLCIGRSIRKRRSGLRPRLYNNLKSHPSIGRAEALRRAMLSFFSDPSDQKNPYPAFWAPHLITGEGAGR